jgi:hypothetical protein
MADITVTVDTSQVTKAEKAFDKLGTSILDQVRKADMLERGYKDLDNAFNKGYISLDRYAKGVQQLDAVIDGLRKGTTQATAAQQRLAAATQQSTREIGQSSTLMQQFGYQAGDFIVQVQSGTNAFVAFGQQATQVAGTLTLLGGKWIAIGSALGVGIPLATAAMAAWSRTNKDVEDSIKTVEDAVKNLTDAYDTAAESAGSFQNIVKSFNVEQIAKGYETLGDRLAETFAPSLLDSMMMSLRGYGPDDVQFKVIEENLQKAFGVFGKTSADTFGVAFLDNIQTAIREGDVQALEDIINSLDAFSNRNALGDQFIRDLIKAVDLMKGFNDEVKDATDEIQNAIDLGKELGGLNIKLGVDAAAAAAKLLAERLGIALAQAQRMVGLATGQGVSGPDAARAQVRETYFGQSGLRQEDIVDTFSFSARIPSSGGGSVGGGSSVSPTQQAEEYLQKLEREAEFKRSLVGLSDEQAAIETRREQLVNQLNGYEEGLSDAYTQRIEEILKTEAETRKLMEAEQQRQQLMNTIEGHIENAFMSMVDGSKSVEDAFKSMLRNIILAIYQEKVAKAGANAIMNLLGLANGGAFERGGKFTAYANGGVVGSPTMFSHSGGLGVMGEAGPEAIMPLKRGKNGKLGVQMEGNSGNVTVVQNFNMSANGDESVKRIIRQETPRIAEQAKAAVVDAKRRGGTYGRSF